MAYASRTLRGAELNYAATDLEALGMKFALKQFRPYVHGRAFVMETDHIALTWLRTINHSSSRRLMRTAMEMQDLQMTIVYKPGLSMHDADALSRLARELPGTEGEHRLQKEAGATIYSQDPTTRDAYLAVPALLSSLKEEERAGKPAPNQREKKPPPPPTGTNGKVRHDPGRRDEE